VSPKADVLGAGLRHSRRPACPVAWSRASTQPLRSLPGRAGATGGGLTPQPAATTLGGLVVLGSNRCRPDSSRPRPGCLGGFFWLWRTPQAPVSSNHPAPTASLIGGGPPRKTGGGGGKAAASSYVYVRRLDPLWSNGPIPRVRSTFHPMITNRGLPPRLSGRTDTNRFCQCQNRKGRHRNPASNGPDPTRTAGKQIREPRITEHRTPMLSPEREHTGPSGNQMDPTRRQGGGGCGIEEFPVSPMYSPPCTRQSSHIPQYEPSQTPLPKVQRLLAPSFRDR